MLPGKVESGVVCASFVNQADPTDVITKCFKANELIEPTIGVRPRYV